MIPKRPLPPACRECRPYDGAWRDTGHGLQRCDCARGKALAMGPRWHQRAANANDGKQKGAGE